MGTKRSAEELRACIKLVEERIDGVKDKHIHYEQINVYGEQLTELYKELREAEKDEKAPKTQEVVSEKRREDGYGSGGGTSCTDPHWRWM